MKWQLNFKTTIHFYYNTHDCFSGIIMAMWVFIDRAVCNAVSETVSSSLSEVLNNSTKCGMI